MLEIHPRGQKDVKGKGTAIKPPLEMMRFLVCFFFFPLSLKYLYFNVMNSLVAMKDERQDAPRRSGALGSGHSTDYSKASNTRARSS